MREVSTCDALLVPIVLGDLMREVSTSAVPGLPPALVVIAGKNCP